METLELKIAKSSGKIPKNVGQILANLIFFFFFFSEKTDTRSKREIFINLTKFDKILAKLAKFSAISNKIFSFENGAKECFV